MSRISLADVKIYEDFEDYIKFKNKKAIFETKIASDMNHNNEIVNVLGKLKGRDLEHDRYVVQFEDGTIENCIMDNELEMISKEQQREKKEKRNMEIR